jgi:hypothetical protein
LLHKQDTFLVAKEAIRLASESYNDGPRNSINDVGDFCNEINVLSNSPYEQVKWAKERDLDQSYISIALAPKPLQEEIKRRILEKDWATYQRRDKQVQTQPQEPPTQPSAPIPQPQMAQDLQPRVMLQREQRIQPTKTSSDVLDMSKGTCEYINIDLKSYFPNPISLSLSWSLRSYHHKERKSNKFWD